MAHVDWGLNQKLFNVFKIKINDKELIGHDHRKLSRVYKNMKKYFSK